MTNVGLVGVGYWGQNYLRVFDEIPASSLEWVADLDEDRLETVSEHHPEIRVTTDYGDLLADDSLDAVCIATPPGTHFKIASEFVDAGVHVLVEKPLTTEPATAWELSGMAERNDVTIVVGHIFEYHGAVRRVKEYVERGDLGDLHYMGALRTGLGPIRTEVSALWDLAVHDVSIFRYLLDSDVAAVSCIGHSFLQDVPDSIFLFVEFEDGTIGHTHCSWLHPQKTRKVTVVGDEKMAVFNDTDPERILQLYDSTVETHQPTGLDEFHYTVREGDVLLPSVQVREPLKVQAQHFLECITSGEKPLTGGPEGARVIEILATAQESLDADGSWMTV